MNLEYRWVDMQSREFKCFDKILTVCNNRGLGDLGGEIIKKLGPGYLTATEIKQLGQGLTKTVKYAEKVSFLDSIKYSNACVICSGSLAVGDPAFLQGKSLYHVLCGLENLGERASGNHYYKRWSVQIKTNEYAEEI